MPQRLILRRKVVLPVTIIRNNGEQRQLAHTLDVTANSARLGGLYIPIEPDDIIEIQRNLVRGKFRVHWVGATGTMLSGQAGLRGLAERSIWGIDLPADEPDFAREAERLRSALPLVRIAGADGDRRRASRFDCKGGAAVRASGYGYPIYAQIADVSQGGVYLETTTVLPVNTQVYVKLSIEGVVVEMPGLIRSSDDFVGMGVAFQTTTRENQQKLVMALKALQSKASPAPQGRVAAPLAYIR